MGFHSKEDEPYCGIDPTLSLVVRDFDTKGLIDTIVQ